MTTKQCVNRRLFGVSGYTMTSLVLGESRYGGVGVVSKGAMIEKKKIVVSDRKDCIDLEQSLRIFSDDAFEISLTNARIRTKCQVVAVKLQVPDYNIFEGDENGNGYILFHLADVRSFGYITNPDYMRKQIDRIRRDNPGKNITDVYYKVTIINNEDQKPFNDYKINLIYKQIEQLTNVTSETIEDIKAFAATSIGKMTVDGTKNHCMCFKYFEYMYCSEENTETKLVDFVNYIVRMYNLFKNKRVFSFI